MHFRLDRSLNEDNKKLDLAQSLLKSDDKLELNISLSNV